MHKYVPTLHHSLASNKYITQYILHLKFNIYEYNLLLREFHALRVNLNTSLHLYFIKYSNLVCKFIVWKSLQWCWTQVYIFCLAFTYKRHSQTKCMSSSLYCKLHSSHNRSWTANLENLPVSIFNGNIPHLSCTRRDLLCQSYIKWV